MMQCMKPVVGISCCTKLFSVFAMPNHAASDTYVRAAVEVVDAVPLLIPAGDIAHDVDTLLSRLDGIILTGSRSRTRRATASPCR